MNRSTCPALVAVLLLACGEAAPMEGSLTGLATLTGEADSSGVSVFLAGSSHDAHTAADGRFTLSGVPNGSYRLLATHPGYAQVGADVNVQGAELEVPALALVKLETTGRVSGVATLEGATDSTGISVIVPGTAFAASTDSSGSYALDLPEGHYTLTAQAPGYLSQGTEVSVTVGSSVEASSLSLAKQVPPAPTITSLSRAVARRGDLLTVYGTNFGASQDTNLVHVNSELVTSYRSWSDTQLEIRIPTTVRSGPGTLTVTIGSQQASAEFVLAWGPSIAGGYEHTLAIATDGTVVAWGGDAEGQSSVPAGLRAVAVAGGDFHSVALKSDGTVVAWGANSLGQTTVPANLSGVVGVVAGGFHSLALKSDGTVAAWGYNVSGQATVPAGLSGVLQIAAGRLHSLALKSDRTVVAWGANTYGQATVPAGLSGVVSIVAREGHSLALKSDGTVVAWGANGYGQTNVPAGLSGVVGIAAGDVHSLALKSDGTVVAWGDSGFGQATVPAGLSRVVGIAASGHHSLALKSDGTVVVWGRNNAGQATVPVGLQVLVPES